MLKDAPNIGEIYIGLKLSSAIGSISRFSDKGEHLEGRNLETTLMGAIGALGIGHDLALADCSEGFGQRIASVLNELEKTHINHTVGKQPLLYESILGANNTDTTWRTIQALQSQHDTAYHPDVVGPGPRYHYTHNAVHLGSTNGKIAESILANRGIADRQDMYTNVMIFSVKALTLLNYELPSDMSHPAGWKV